jgi:hypothetical protein
MKTLTKMPALAVLAGCGLVLFITAHGIVAWLGAGSSGTIGGWLPWLVGGALTAFGLHHAIRHLRSEGYGHSHYFSGREHDHQEVECGPHGGFLVNLGHGFVEITIGESDTPRRFRLFFRNRRKQPRSVPAHATVMIDTVRPDGACQAFAFHAKGEYLESTDEIPEPYEFKAIVRASHGRHTHPPLEVQFSAQRFETVKESEQSSRGSRGGGVSGSERRC